MKRLSPAPTGSRQRFWRDITVAEVPPERSKAWTPEQAPQPRAPELGSAAHIAPHSEKHWGFYPMGRDGDHWRQNHFYQGPKHKIFIYSQSPWALVKGGQYRLEMPEEILEWEVLGRNMRGAVIGIPVQSHTPQYCSSYFSWEEKAPPRWIGLGESSETLLAPPAGILFAPPCI